MSIKTVDSLREHLQWALELEHATLPPYMCALYSIKEGTNQAAREILTSILMEEMLHMTLVANLLNAVGGTPILAKPGFIAQYPTPLPHGGAGFEVPLLKFSPEAMETFLNIEKPAPHDGPAQDENYQTLGQFYEAIEDGLKYLSADMGEEALFSGDPKRQLSSSEEYYGGSGTIIPVTNLASALEAMIEIIEQGEGLDFQQIKDGDKQMFHPDRDEVGHYFRIQEIIENRKYKMGDTPTSGPTGDLVKVDWDAVYNMRPNPTPDDYPEGTEIREKIDAFNAVYSDMLRILQHCFNGKPHLLGLSVGRMYDLKTLAIELMQVPSGDGQTTVGPAFRYIAASESKTSEGMKIVIQPDGPYVVHGSIPLFVKLKVISEKGEPLTWQTGPEIPTTGVRYSLCRCGQSASKPFCDGTHKRINFDGTETAATSTTAERQEMLGGQGINVKSDRTLCIHAAFCNNRGTSVRNMVPLSANIQVRTEMIGMIEHCPSGTFTYELDGEYVVDDKVSDIEPHLPKEIGVVFEGTGHGGPLWVTGGIEVERADGKPLETRNRMTFCRCGASRNKPFCDGSHNRVDWDPALKE